MDGSEVNPLERAGLSIVGGAATACVLLSGCRMGEWVGSVVQRNQEGKKYKELEV